MSQHFDTGGSNQTFFKAHLQYQAFFTDLCCNKHNTKFRKKKREKKKEKNQKENNMKNLDEWQIICFVNVIVQGNERHGLTMTDNRVSN